MTLNQAKSLKIDDQIQTKCKRYKYSITRKTVRNTYSIKLLKAPQNGDDYLIVGKILTGFKVNEICTLFDLVRSSRHPLTNIFK